MKKKFFPKRNLFIKWKKTVETILIIDEDRNTSSLQEKALILLFEI